MKRTACARIDLGALRHNIRQIRAYAPASRIMAVVKAEAYGHGLLRVSEALSGLADGFAVSCIEEGLALRGAGIVEPILALQGYREAAELKAAAVSGIQLALHQEDQLRLLENTVLPRPVGIWVKLNTGMNRLGFAPARAADVFQRLTSCVAVRGIPGLMSHFACADEPDRPVTGIQIAAFDDATAGLPGPRSLANSAAIIKHPASHRDWVRPGITLYGASPFADPDVSRYGLQPVMTVSAPLIAINELRAGDAFGYGGDFVCDRPMRIGIAAIGYGDGYPRHATTGTPVLVNGVRTRLLGRVSMDMIAVDLDALPGAAVGDPVVAWGEGLPVDEVAQAVGTIGYELLCAVGERLRIDVRE